MSPGSKIACKLCQRSVETKVTGPLATEDSVTAHQNCLLYSAGIVCKFTPEFDDLFGFSATDVLEEVKRGNKLYCNRCKKKGATAGCEIGRCKKSYHYPCAVEDGAEIVEDEDGGRYVLFCFKHKRQTEKDKQSVDDGQAGTSGKFRQARPSEINGTASQKEDENISFEILPCDVSMLNSDQHSSSVEKVSGTDRDAGAGPSYNSGSDSPGSVKRGSVKRRLSYNGKQEGTASKRKSEGRAKRPLLDSSDSDENGNNTDIDSVLGPLESDIEDSENATPKQELLQPDRENAEITIDFISGNEPVDENRNDDDKDEDKCSDAESQSMLRPELGDQLLPQTDLSPEQHPRNGMGIVVRADVHAVEAPVPQQSSTDPAPCSDHREPLDVTSSPPHGSSTVSPAVREIPSPPRHTSPATSVHPSSSSPEPLPSVLEASCDSATFWKDCNMAGCTQGIFTDFINEMNNISSRIQADEASQGDYDLAYKVMMASGKLAELATKQQKELEKKEAELQKAAAAMKKVMSAVRK